MFHEPDTDGALLLHRYMTIPNGQVKNFLVACRTTCYERPSWRIAVIGSKASERGGLWHRLYAIFMSQYSSQVVIDFFDPNEIDAEWCYQTRHSTVSCQWWAQEAPEDALSSYDAVVSDIWTVEELSVSSRENFPECYSMKGANDVKSVPFLHEAETRFFSHHGHDEVVAGCSCLVCSVVKQCVRNWQEYIQLRHFVARLGHAPVCPGMSHVHDLIDVSQVQKMIFSGELVKATKHVARIATSLTEEVGIVATNRATIIKSGDPVFRVIDRFYTSVSTDHREVFSELQGCSVAFVGVSSSIIGRTQVVATLPIDVTFVRTLTSWGYSSVGPRVYCPVSPQTVALMRPGWLFTGRVINGYNEYTRPKEKSPVATSLHYRTVSPVQLGARRDSVRGTYYSVEVREGICYVVPFQEEKRVSISVSVQGDWSYAYPDILRCPLPGVGPWNRLDPRLIHRSYHYVFQMPYDIGYATLVTLLRSRPVDQKNGRTVRIGRSSFKVSPDVQGVFTAMAHYGKFFLMDPTPKGNLYVEVSLFDEAVHQSKLLLWSRDEQILLYGWSQQSIFGDITSCRPSMVEEYDYWDAWHKCMGMSSSKAKSLFVSFVHGRKPPD